MSYRITVNPSGHTFDAEPSETLLQSGLRAGLNLTHGCANGSCGECRARLESGDIATMRHFDFRFSEREKQQGWFLLCSCQAMGDVEFCGARDRHRGGDSGTTGARQSQQGRPTAG
ncbi:MAG: 2Fe-2S iron-sulfur cluster binding domain-containing protein [Chromatiaceae bacterium]|nr:2Fe-2S iron-sulfur cluster binding domain-containing protein [Chromatiaceae bacterium]